MTLVVSSNVSEDLPEKNTFIDYPPIPMADVCKIPSKTAPAELLQRLAKRFSNPETTATEESLDEAECANLYGMPLDCQYCSNAYLSDARSCRKFGKPRFEACAVECQADFDCGSSTDCPTELPPTPPEDEWEDLLLPSLGSVEHASGSCNPCAWYWKPQGCQNGMNCVRCHLCPKGELKTRRKIKEKHLRAQAKTSTTHKMHIELVSDNLTHIANVPCVMENASHMSKPADASGDDSSLMSRWESQFGDRSEPLPNISVKNTFIQVPKFAPEPPTKSAPGALLTQRFRIKVKTNEGEAAVSNTLQAFAPTPDSIEAVTSTGPSMQCREDTSGKEVAPHGGSEAHTLGQCIPCAYFWDKKDGCRIGDKCKFCHLCQKGEIKKRKRERIQQLKADGEYKPRSSLRHEK